MSSSSLTPRASAFERSLWSAASLPHWALCFQITMSTAVILLHVWLPGTKRPLPHHHHSSFCVPHGTLLGRTGPTFFLRHKVQACQANLFYIFFSFSLFFFGWYCSIFFFVPRMLIPTWNRCCALMFLVAALRTGTSQVLEAARPKANSIKPALLEETPTPPTNRSATVHTGVTKKHSILAQVITKKKKTL